MNIIRFNTDLFNSIFGAYYNDGCTSVQQDQNIYSDDDNFYLEMVLAGYNKEDIKIDVKNDKLTISSNIDSDNKNEWFKKSFSESFRIGKTVNLDNIEAEMVNGILKLTLPKLEKTSKNIRKIEVK